MNSQCFTYRNDSYLALFDALCYVGVEGVEGEGVVSCLRDIRLLETFSFVKLEFVFLFVQRQRLSLEVHPASSLSLGQWIKGSHTTTGNILHAQTLSFSLISISFSIFLFCTRSFLDMLASREHYRSILNVADVADN